MNAASYFKDQIRPSSRVSIFKFSWDTRQLMDKKRFQSEGSLTIKSGHQRVVGQKFGGLTKLKLTLILKIKNKLTF